MNEIYFKMCYFKNPVFIYVWSSKSSGKHPLAILYWVNRNLWNLWFKKNHRFYWPGMLNRGVPGHPRQGFFFIETWSYSRDICGTQEEKWQKAIFCFPGVSHLVKYLFCIQKIHKKIVTIQCICLPTAYHDCRGGIKLK